MTTQELRRLGVLPYAEDDRRIRTFEVGNTVWVMTQQTLQVPSRRLRGEWTIEESHTSDVIVDEEAIQQISDEIDQDIIDHINNTGSPPIVEPVNEPVNERVDDIHPNRYDNTSVARRAWRSFIERFHT